MKKMTLLFIFVIGTGVFGIYGQTKDADILKLLRISGSDKLTEQVIALMIPQFQEVFPDIPNTFWKKFMEKINTDELLNACIPIYNKYYTHDEVKQLIAFYETPIGKKLVEVNSLMAQETAQIGQQYGERIGQEIIIELINEGYFNN